MNKIKVHIVEENKIQVFSCYIDALNTPNKFYLRLGSDPFDLKKNYTFCLKALDHIYFFKSRLFSDSNGVFLNQNTRIYEFKRRKHTRFDIPFDWRQSCLIYLGYGGSTKISSQIKNLSWSGIRLELDSLESSFELNQEIQFAIQIYRRAEVLCHGRIMNVKKNKFSGLILGLEFTSSGQLFDNRIQNMCDDLLRYYLLKLKKTS